MKPTTFILKLVLAAVIALGAMGIEGVYAQQEIKTLNLLKSKFAGGDKQRVTLIYEELPPSPASLKPGQYPDGTLHYHTGHAVVYVIEGALEIKFKGKKPRVIGPGGVFEELPGQVIQGKNASSAEWAKLVVFQVTDKDKPLVVDVK
jgi:hypothetical protein